ncbi:chaplin [Nonomuraea sp. NBC_00507]|uniref:chaplin n=1 Tax=unclassified Nonomuraea TaxID=2593643 RepID=UPI00273C492D|nr:MULTISPECIES: chaplin [unclassified Nonomuraea]MDP4503662.1 chaplin [Nonomuraea sp. G32]
MLKKILVVAGAAAMLSLAAPPAHADITSGSGGVLSGNQVHVPISIPINVCGNAVAVLGHAIAGCKGGAKVIGH